MDNCVDHPDELGVFTCKECDRLICENHDNMLCRRDRSASRAAIPLVIFIVIVFFIISVFIFNFIFSLGDIASEYSNLEEGDVITVDGEVTTVGEVLDLPSINTIITFLIILFVPILIVIFLYLRRMMVRDGEPLISLKSLSTKSRNNEHKTYFCQKCGTELTWNDEICSECGKSTDEEKRLVG